MTACMHAHIHEQTKEQKKQMKQIPTASNSVFIHTGVEAMRMFHSFLPSFLATSLPTDFPCTFEFWLAYDRGDPLLDSPQVTLPPHQGGPHNPTHDPKP